MRGITWWVVTLWVGLVFATNALAIPNLLFNPHPHDNPGTIDKHTTWINGADPVPDPDPDAPDTTMHQHRDTDKITGGNGKYIGYSVWDDRSYRNGGNFGHGYMKIDARYLYEADFLNSARTDFDNAVAEWEHVVNGSEVNTNGVPINIRLGFDRVNSGAHEIDVFWNDIGIADNFATAFWDPAATDFTFDSNPTVKVSAPAGFQARLHGSGDPWAAAVNAPSQWHFGGAGDPANVTVNFDCLKVATGDIFPNGCSSTFRAYDFYTISLHEIGHAFGLDHFGVGIMREDISSFVMRDPDAGSVDGLKDLYAIPNPEPGTLLLLSTGLVGLIGYGWKQKLQKSA